MRRLHLLILLLFVVSKAMGVNPKGFYLDNLGNATELLSVKCIGQDEDGLIWFGTDKGLYHFNGYTVKSYLGRISNIQTRCILALNGSVLLGYNGGLLTFDRIEEQFRQVEYFRNDIVNTITRSGDILYIGTDSGLYRVEYKDLHTPGAISKLSSGPVRTMLLRNDRIWTGSFRDYGYYHLQEEKYYPLEFEEDPSRSHFVSTIYAENDSTLWLGTSRAMVRIDFPQYKATNYLPMIVLQTILEDRDGNFVLGTDAGLLLHDRRTGQTEKLRDGVITSSFQDREGNYWLGTDNGLLLLRRNRTVASLASGNLSSNTVPQTILKDRRGRVWAGGLDEIQLYERREGDPYVPTLFFSVGSVSHRIPQKVNKIIEDRSSGDVYVTSDGGLLRYEEETQGFLRIPIPMAHNWVYDVVLDREEMWVAAYDGLFHVRDGEVSAHLTMKDGLSSNDVAQVIRDRSGRIWCLTRDQAVYRIGPEGNAPERFPVEDYMSNPYVDYILSDLEETVWIASKNELIQVHTLPEGFEVRKVILSANTEMAVYSLADIQGRIWICSSAGVFFVNKRSGEISRFSSGKNYVSLAYDRETERLLAGATGRVDAIPFTEIERLSGERLSPVYINSLLVNDSWNVSRKELADGEIVLGNKENNLDITFSDYRYGSDLLHRFVYRLGGPGTPWREVLSNNLISVGNLKAGKYALQISSGSPGEDVPTLLTIRIKRPFFLSTMMILVYLLLFGLLLYVLARLAKLQNNLKVERKERDLLHEQFRQKEEFFTTVSHEFKTPLSLILAPLNKLLHEPHDEETLKMLTIANDNATKLNGLVHNTLDFYRNTSNAPVDLIRVDTDFVEFVRSIFQTFKDNYPKHEFIFSSSQPRIITSIDYVKMEMAISNLLSNACKYTPEGGSVILTLEQDRERDQVVMRLSDTGIGIPPEEIPYIFRRYYESSRTKGSNYDGTGVGLSIIKNVIESHGGRIAAESDDSGSTFTVILPCKEVETESDSRSEDAARSEADKPLIVIVEDNAPMCAFLEEVLSDKYKCISSANGKSGLKLCKDVLPDLIISDVMMPVMDGLEMCRQIRDCKPLSLVPIILLTAKGDVETERKSIDMNIDAFIPKPFDLPVLLSKIDQLMANRQRMEQKLRMDFISIRQEETEVSPDDKFIRKVTELIEEHLDDSDFSVSALCQCGGFNEKQLYRKVKQMTGLSTAEYIRSIRLKKAAMLLQNGNFTIAEVMYSVGFSNASYFTRAFSAEYGKTPSDYKRSHAGKVPLS